MTYRCGECGATLESPDEEHTIFDCAERHLKRAYEILRDNNASYVLNQSFFPQPDISKKSKGTKTRV